jgi:AraC family L-rhamnose operon transcriptional activator RhaR
MSRDPVAEAKGLLYFTDGSLAHARKYSHHGAFPAHTHSFVEIAVTIDGQGEHRTMTGSRPLQRGDVVLLRPGTSHGYEHCRQLTLYNCCFSTELLTRELAWAREDPVLGYLLWTGPYSMHRRGMLTAHLEEEQLHAALDHLDALASLQTQPLAMHRADVIGRLSLFLGHIARAAAEGGRVQRPDPAHPAAAQVMRTLEAHIEREWTLTELADELHLTPSYLARLFKEVTGLPPMAYLARRRVEIAANLLLHSDESVARIGERVGWDDQNYFARRFKAHFGLSPTAYRHRFSATTVAPREGSGTGVRAPARTEPEALPASSR